MQSSRLDSVASAARGIEIAVQLPAPNWITRTTQRWFPPTGTGVLLFLWLMIISSVCHAWSQNVPPALNAPWHSPQAEFTELDTKQILSKDFAVDLSKTYSLGELIDLAEAQSGDASGLEASTGARGCVRRRAERTLADGGGPCSLTYQSGAARERVCRYFVWPIHNVVWCSTSCGVSPPK